MEQKKFTILVLCTVIAFFGFIQRLLGNAASTRGHKRGY